MHAQSRRPWADRIISNASIARGDGVRINQRLLKQDEGAFEENGNAASIYLGMWSALNKIAADFDILFANHSLTALPVAFCRAGRAKRFYYVQAYEPEYFQLESGLRSKILRRLSQLSYKLPLVQIANAPIYINYREIRAKKWIPPGVSREIFQRRTCLPFDSIDDDIFVGVIGRREPSKGIIYALEAFEKLSQTDSRYRLKVAFGNLPKKWTHPKVEVVVPKNDRELADFYRSLDVLIAPGIVQLGACHYPVLEAMACGTPVVTTGYLPANTENAWIVPIKNSSAIASAVERIAGMDSSVRAKYLEKAVNAIEPFMWDNVAEQFLEYFFVQGR
ncbi:glycosyltransferase [Aromatoleum toluvorans]|uniref:Glycosyltransferase n=1 Tax=Aromatoleum toluvorans TaxID=92002 RepID=A0ABX1Q5I2_9RHOO|nr:glycosyltransferase [Aromatoleum toluvorans]